MATFSYSRTASVKIGNRLKVSIGQTEETLDLKQSRRRGVDRGNRVLR